MTVHARLAGAPKSPVGGRGGEEDERPEVVVMVPVLIPITCSLVGKRYYYDEYSTVGRKCSSSG